MSSLRDADAAIEAFDFRSMDDSLRFGTASDRYAGWIGQIYPEHYRKELSSRNRRLGKEVFKEETLPVESVADYFDHFTILELDFTFYRPLLDADGSPTSNFFVLEKYAAASPENARFLLKAPQAFFARVLRRGSGNSVSYIENPGYLNAQHCSKQFLEPAHAILGDRLAGIIYEQEYQRKNEAPGVQQLVVELDEFFQATPTHIQAHIELRTPFLLTPPYFDWLEDRGIGFVFSHWTWLPAIREQWRLCGERLTARNGEVVIRLLTPLKMPYARAYSQAYPFDKTLPDIANSEGGKNMILDVTALAFQARKKKAILNIIANNRAWGNSPELARTIARRILMEEQKRS